MTEHTNHDFKQSNLNQTDLKQYTTITYGLYIASLLIGFTSIVAVIMNYLKRDEARGTWLESHFDWQIKTFWYSLIGGVIGFLLLIVLIGYLVLMAVGVWYIYRVIKGMILLLDNKPIGDGWI